jgi:hypothetical protein
LQRRVLDLELKLDRYIHDEQMRRAEAKNTLWLRGMLGVTILFAAVVWIAILIKAV